MSTLLCVPIMVQDEASALADAVAARDAGADFVEFRIDEFFSGARDSHGELDGREVEGILRIVAGSVLPCIVTCRAASEGGQYDGDEAARVALYERLGTAHQSRGAQAPGGSPEGSRPARRAGPPENPPRYLDLEYAAYRVSANLRQKVHLAVDWPALKREGRPGLILSMHDFNGRPGDLLRRLGAMQEEEAARVVKVAYTMRSVRDNLELFDLLSENREGRGGGKPMIALGMGRFGLMSRVLAPKFGGFLTFASLRRESATAPGQPTVSELVDTYRFRSIGPGTRVYGVIGWPVEHSLSPLLHNAGFEALGADDWTSTDVEPDPPVRGDAVYLPLPVPPEYEHFKATVLALVDHVGLDFGGCSVTVPHKQHLVRLAREQIAAGDEVEWSVDEMSEACGAGNTLVVERDRLGNALRARVVNTDAGAATGVLREAIGALGGLKGKRVVLVGAGGVARAIAAGLLREGAKVVVCARRASEAERMAVELGGSAWLREGGGEVLGMGMEGIGSSACEALVNCTPVGMSGGPAPKESPLDVGELRRVSPGAVVMDTVYSPLITALLERASLAGFRTIDGVGMFVRQAGEQFELWTGASAPLGLFERVARDALGAREGGA